MNYKVTVIVGLPGSGKSHYINEHADKDTMIVDDPKHISELPDKLTSNLIIADCHLCKPKSREALNNILDIRYPKAEIEYIFFENNPDQCLKNVKHRNDGRYVEPTIKNYSKVYTIPEDAITVSIFDTTTLKNKSKNRLRPR
jgi:predicted kinase